MGVSATTFIFYSSGDKESDVVHKDSALACFRWSRFSRPYKLIRMADVATKKLVHRELQDTNESVKRTVIIRTERGYLLECSDDSIIATDSGWIAVADLKVGQKVMVNGTPDERYKDKDTLKRWYIDENKTQLEIAKMTGASEHTIRVWVKKFNLNRGDAGALFGKDNPKYKGDLVSFKGGYMRTHAEYDTKLDLTTCSRCGATGVEMNIHHDDRNPTNTNEDNLEVLCVMCHKLEHLGPAVRHISYDHISSIGYGGMQKVYDFKTELGNYVADGLIVRGIQ